jgi:hypothetical protein
MTNDIFQAEFMKRSRRWQNSIDRHIAKPLVGTGSVIKVCPLVENMPQVVLAEDDEVIETLCFRPPHIRLRVGIQIWTMWWISPELYTIGFQDRTELLGELAVAITYDVSGSELSGLFTEEHAHVPCDLSHPGAIGIGRHAGNVNAAGVQVNEKEHVISNRTPDRPDSLGEEVASSLKIKPSRNNGTDTSCDEEKQGGLPPSNGGHGN